MPSRIDDVADIPVPRRRPSRAPIYIAFFLLVCLAAGKAFIGLTYGCWKEVLENDACPSTPLAQSLARGSTR